MAHEIILALVAMMSFGITGIIYKVATARIDPVSLTLFLYVFATVFTAVFWYFSPETNKVITKEGIKWVALGAVFAVIGMVCYISALKIDQASIIVPIRNLALVVTVILAIILLGEGITMTKVTGVIFAVVALILLSLGS